MAFKKEKKSPILKKKIEETNVSNFKVSLQYLDTTQKYGSAWKDWQSAGLLSKAMETLQGYCKRPLQEQVCGVKFTIYKDFPATDKTHYEYPEHVPEDACWARIHITGAAVLAGHIYKDTFYVVFLDKTHKFYLTKKVTGK
ncbi:MAG: hypothetical protein V4622_09875 [Bacteroidota bacterium]